MEERDFEWFEAKYPAVYSKFGTYWENYRKLKPAQQSPNVYVEQGYIYSASLLELHGALLDP